jgi:hypothetical protein
LSQCKQEHGEALHKYTCRFFETRATIPNISEEDVINCFRKGISDELLYREFGRNRPKTFIGRRDMMQQWADQEEQERDRFPKHDGDYYSNNGKQGNNDWNVKS